MARSPVQLGEFPASALLRDCLPEGAYADCYFVEVEGSFRLEAFIEAFYTTALFKVERAILGLFVGRSSSDDDARRLAVDATDVFAAWRVQGRAMDQIVLADFTGRTKSWLMCLPVAVPAQKMRTRLYFGSAVMPRLSKSGGHEMGTAFHVLLGFHRLYSRLLLGSARRRLVHRAKVT